VLTVALLNRILHHSIIVSINGDNKLAPQLSNRQSNNQRHLRHDGFERSDAPNRVRCYVGAERLGRFRSETLAI